MFETYFSSYESIPSFHLFHALTKLFILYRVKYTHSTLIQHPFGLKILLYSPPPLRSPLSFAPLLPSKSITRRRLEHGVRKLANEREREVVRQDGTKSRGSAASLRGVSRAGVVKRQALVALTIANIILSF